MLNVIIANVVGFVIIYAMWCFYDWEIVKIEPLGKWKSEGRLALLIAVMMLSFIGLLFCV